MKIEMLLYMETEDDDEPLTKEQWNKELNDIIMDVSDYINRKHCSYVKNADGEHSFEYEGSYEYNKKTH